MMLISPSAGLPIVRLASGVMSPLSVYGDGFSSWSTALHVLLEVVAIDQAMDDFKF